MYQSSDTDIRVDGTAGCGWHARNIIARPSHLQQKSSSFTKFLGLFSFIQFFFKVREMMFSTTWFNTSRMWLELPFFCMFFYCRKWFHISGIRDIHFTCCGHYHLSYICILVAHISKALPWRKETMTQRYPRRPSYLQMKNHLNFCISNFIF